MLYYFSAGTWCQLAYWEECNRVGRLYPVSASTIEVFSALPKGDGLCLASLFKQNKKPSESTARTREKIGQGWFSLTIIYEFCVEIFLIPYDLVDLYTTLLDS